jgi:ferredoxin
MERSPALLLCGLDCRPDLELDMQRLARRLQAGGVFSQVLVEAGLCGNHLKNLTRLQGKRILFGGCSVLESGDFYARAARALSIAWGDALAVNVMEDLVRRYGKGPGLEQNLIARLLAAARVLERAESVPEESLSAGGGALVYGSGLSGLQAALKLAAAGIPVDVLPTADYPLSPGCLQLLLQSRRPAEALRERVREQEAVAILEAGEEMGLVGRNGGFEGGDGRRYGCVVFAPERPEADPVEIGSLNMTRLYTRLAEGGKITGTCVLLFDHGEETAPEVFRDGLAAALAIRSAGRARVYVLSRDVQVSLPDLELLYAACREAGVLFLKYGEELAVENDSGDFVLAGYDEQSGRPFRLPHPDVLVISRPARLSGAALSFAGRLSLRLDRDGCARPGNLWFPARATSRPGVFACGAARGHLDAPGVERDAEALAESVRQRLRPGGIAVPERRAVVDGEKCAFCLTCVRACPAGAMGKDSEQHRAVVDPGACLACGVCAAACPAQAVQLRNLGAEAISAGIEALA